MESTNKPPQALVERVQKLHKVIDDLRYRYHVLDDPSVTDADYDSLMRELVEYEEKYPELRTSDSPSQKIGGQPLAKFKKAEHSTSMLSLQDVFTEEEFLKWVERTEKLAGQKLEYYVELKVDGLAVALRYEKGLLICGAT